MNARTLSMFKDRLKASFKSAGLEAGLYQMNFVDGNILQLKFFENRIGNITFQFTDENGKITYNEEIAKCMPVGVSCFVEFLIPGQLLGKKSVA